MPHVFVINKRSPHFHFTESMFSWIQRSLSKYCVVYRKIIYKYDTLWHKQTFKNYSKRNLTNYKIRTQCSKINPKKLVDTNNNRSRKIYSPAFFTIWSRCKIRDVHLCTQLEDKQFCKKCLSGDGRALSERNDSKYQFL